MYACDQFVEHNYYLGNINDCPKGKIKTTTSMKKEEGKPS